MPSSEYWRRQAALCLRVAAAVDDQSVVAALVMMADDFSVKADEFDPSLGSPGEAAVDGRESAVSADGLGGK
jgi:hypothetical protein